MKRLLNLVLLLSSALLMPQHSHAAPAVDPLNAEIQFQDAKRFARAFKEHGGKLDAAQIQKLYLDGSGPGVAIFTTGRIENAANLAKAVAERQADYQHAIEHCLPQIPSLNTELRAIYLAHRGLLPEKPLPAIHVVFGAGSSGGTANAQAQVLGLEVACRVGVSTEQFRQYMRYLFAHETVHSWQSFADKPWARDVLLETALLEGVPEYLASLVIGKSPDANREQWCRPREVALWQDFMRDQQILMKREKEDFWSQPELASTYQRWFANLDKAPAGWPHEVGYWIGMQIAAGYVEKAQDKRKAIQELIEMKDPAAILQTSGYAQRMKSIPKGTD